MSDLKKPVQLGYGNSTASTPLDEGIRVTLPDVSELEGLPECGTITFRYVRESLNLRTTGETKLSAELRLCEITAVEAGPDCEEEAGDPVDKLFAEVQAEADSDGSGENS